MLEVLTPLERHWQENDIFLPFIHVLHPSSLSCDVCKTCMPLFQMQ